MSLIEHNRGRIIQVKGLNIGRVKKYVLRKVRDYGDFDSYWIDHKYREVLFQKLREFKNPRLNDILDKIESRPYNVGIGHKPDFKNFEMHYDQFSDWNVVMSTGCDAFFRTGRKEFLVSDGDIMIFNGDKVSHAVEMLSSGRRRCGKYKRFTYQIRRYIN